MKKVLATLVALSLPAVVLADDNRGFYVQGDLGYSTLKTSDEGGKVSSKGSVRACLPDMISAISVSLPITPTIKLGKTMNRVRLTHLTQKSNSKASAFPPFMIST